MDFLLIGFVILLGIAHVYGTLKLISRVINYLEIKTIYYSRLIEKMDK